MDDGIRTPADVSLFVAEALREAAEPHASAVVWEYWPGVWDVARSYAGEILPPDVRIPGAVEVPTNYINYDKAKLRILADVVKNLEWLQERLPKQKRKWGHGEVEAAIQSYKQEHLADYTQFVNELGTAKQKFRHVIVAAARKTFGRNAIARKLGCVPSAVGRSPTWRAMAEALDLEKHRATVRATSKRGLDIVLEAKADAKGDETFDDVERRELLERIDNAERRRLIDPQSASDLRDRIHRGEKPLDNITELLDLLTADS